MSGGGMLSTVQIGRAAPLGGDLAVESLSLTGEKLSVSGWLFGPTREDMTRQAAQLASLVDSVDEPFVPVLWDNGPQGMDGYYRVTDVDLSSVRPEAWKLSAALERIPGSPAPLFENRTIGATRKDHTGTTYFWHALSSDSLGYSGVFPTSGGAGTTPSMNERPCAPPDGAVESRTLTIFRDYGLRDARVYFYLRPQDWYLGAATLHVDDQLVLGRQVPQSWKWTLSNGVIRLHGNRRSAAVTMERWDGARWVTMGDWTVGRPEGTSQLKPMAAPHSLTVLRNSPQLVSIRLAVDAKSMYPDARFVVNLDISLRRGSTYAEVALSTRGAYRWGYRSPMLYTNATISSTWLHTGGGQRAVSTRQPTASVVNNGGYAEVRELSLVTDQEWMWGALPPSETVSTIYAQYLAAMTEQISVVAR